MRLIDWIKRIFQRKQVSAVGSTVEGAAIRNSDESAHVPLRSEQTQKWDRTNLLMLRTAIAGLSYRLKKQPELSDYLRSSLHPGKPLRLVREPDNDCDRWAIAVYTTDDRKLGYITRFKNEPIARMMDEGGCFHAYVDGPIGPEDILTPTEDIRIPIAIYMDIYRRKKDGIEQKTATSSQQNKVESQEEIL